MHAIACAEQSKNKRKNKNKYHLCGAEPVRIALSSVGILIQPVGPLGSPHDIVLLRHISGRPQTQYHARPAAGTQPVTRSLVHIMYKSVVGQTESTDQWHNLLDSGDCGFAQKRQYRRRAGKRGKPGEGCKREGGKAGSS